MQKILPAAVFAFFFAFSWTMSLALADDKAETTPSVADPDPEIQVTPDSIEISPGRPEWTNEKPDYSGALHSFPVASGPFALESDAKRALDKELVAATRKYVVQQLGPQAARGMTFDAKSIKTRFVKKENVYQDVARYSVGPMHEIFVKLEYGPDFRKELKARARKVEARHRLEGTTVAAGVSLLALATVFGACRFSCRKNAGVRPA